MLSPCLSPTFVDRYLSSICAICLIYLDISVSESPGSVMALFRENSGDRPDGGNCARSELAAIKNEANSTKSSIVELRTSVVTGPAPGAASCLHLRGRCWCLK